MNCLRNKIEDSIALLNVHINEIEDECEDVLHRIDAKKTYIQGILGQIGIELEILNKELDEYEPDLDAELAQLELFEKSHEDFCGLMARIFNNTNRGK